MSAAHHRGGLLRGSDSARAVAIAGGYTAASLAATMGLGAVLAVLVLRLFGTTATTDAFFAAYGVFAFLSAAASSTRVSLPAQLHPGSGWPAVNRALGGVVVLGLATSVPLVALGGVTAQALVGPLGSDAVGTARTTLAYLWAAGTLQLLAGVLAAALGARGEHKLVAVSHVAGASATLGLLLQSATHIRVAHVGALVTVGSVITATILGARVLALGWRPGLDVMGVRVAVQILAAAAPALSIQAGFVVTAAAAAQLGQGAVTLYSYAFFGALLVIGVTAAPAAMVLAGPVAEAWDRQTDSLLPAVVTVTRAALLVAAPLLATGVLIGDEIVLLVVGDELARAEAATITVHLLALAGLVVAQVAAVVPLVAGLAQHRHVPIAVATTAGLAVHVLLTGLLDDDGSQLALATSLSNLVTLAGLLVAVFGREAMLAARTLTTTIGAISLLSVGAYAAASAIPSVPGATEELSTSVWGAGLVALAAALIGRSGWPGSARRLQAPGVSERLPAEGFSASTTNSL